MNHIILFEKDFITSNKVCIQDRRLMHVTSVLKPVVGDSLKVGLLNGLMGSGMITSLSNDSLHLEVSLYKEPPAPLPVSLVIALPRPKIIKRLIQCVTAMGVKRLAFIRTWKVEKSYWQSPVLSNESLHHEMILGLEQAGDTILPEITLHNLFKPFIEDKLETFSNGTRCFTAHPGASVPCPHSISDPSTIAIGPEAGFIPYEITMLEKSGFLTVSMGERILRVDQAVPAILGRLYV